MGSVAIAGRAIIAGTAAGFALVTDEPLSFWGGYNWKNGEIIDHQHPLFGESARGKVLVIPSTRGSSTTTAVLLEAIREGTAPIAVVTTANDFFFALASIVAGELYGRSFPLIAVASLDFGRIRTGEHIEIMEDGKILMTTARADYGRQC